MSRSPSFAFLIFQSHFFNMFIFLCIMLDILSERGTINCHLDNFGLKEYFLGGDKINTSNLISIGYFHN